MGMVGQKVRSVKFVIDGVDELQTHVDALETKVDDMITLVKVLSDELAELKKAEEKPVKKPVKKAAPKKKAVK